MEVYGLLKKQENIEPLHLSKLLLNKLKDNNFKNLKLKTWFKLLQQIKFTAQG